MNPPFTLPLALAVGCAGSLPAVEAPTGTSVRSLAFEVQGSFRLLDGAELVTVPPHAVTLSGRLEVEPTRRFEDGSIGELWRFEDVDAADADGEPIAWDLSGRVVELRRFPDGEILEIVGVEHLRGPDRLGDVFDLLFPVASPSVPELEPGTSTPRRQVWPMLDADGGGWRSTLRATWEDLGSEGEGRRLRYEGPLELSGRDPHLGGSLSAEGAAEGVVLFATDGGALERHDFAWSRVVELGGDRTGLRLEQRQDFQGWMKASGSP